MRIMHIYTRIYSYDCRLDVYSFCEAACRTRGTHIRKPLHIYSRVIYTCINHSSRISGERRTGGRRRWKRHHLLDTDLIYINVFTPRALVSPTLAASVVTTLSRSPHEGNFNLSNIKE